MNMILVGFTFGAVAHLSNAALIDLVGKADETGLLNAASVESAGRLAKPRTGTPLYIQEVNAEPGAATRYEFRSRKSLLVLPQVFGDTWIPCDRGAFWTESGTFFHSYQKESFLSRPPCAISSSVFTDSLGFLHDIMCRCLGCAFPREDG